MKNLPKPEIRLIRFDKEDIITASGEGTPPVLGQFNFAQKAETKPGTASAAEDQDFVGFVFSITSELMKEFP